MTARHPVPGEIIMTEHNQTADNQPPANENRNPEREAARQQLRQEEERARRELEEGLKELGMDGEEIIARLMRDDEAYGE